METPDDPLSDWLGKSRPRSAPGRAGRQPYVPFKPVDRKQLRVRICPRGRAWEWLPYLGLQRIVTDADYGTRLGLVWGYAVVEIKGRNLQELDAALAQERCEFIRAFHPDQFEPVTDTTTPFIDSIDIHLEQRQGLDDPNEPGAKPEAIHPPAPGAH